jgi:hypothetical protein
MSLKQMKNKLVITLKMCNPVPSRSGKTLLVATTRGVRKSAVEVDGRRVRFVANAFISNQKASVGEGNPPASRKPINRARRKPRKT